MTAPFPLFSTLTQAPHDPILGLNEAFQADPNPKKINLCIGIYYDAEGKVPILSCVQKALQELISKSLPRTYQPIEGPASYTQAVQHLLLGKEHPAVREQRAVTVQSLGGTGALKLGADLLYDIEPKAKVWVSDPTWDNHRAIFEDAGFQVSAYTYYDASTGGFNLEGMLRSLQQAKPGDIVVLHACCHNPTGVDPSPEDWGKIIELVEQQQLVPFLDIAYQGFGNGIVEDGEVIARFAARHLPAFITSSFSKNFSLYGERVGALTVLCSDVDEAKRLRSQLKRIIRTNYSNPPIHGAALVTSVLGHPELRALWEQELAVMRTRIREMRGLLRERLQAQLPGRDFSYITRQKGMFSYTGLTATQAQKLRKEHAIYIVDTGRICVAGLNERNIEAFAHAMATVLK